MTTELQDRKLAKVFNYLDADGNGVLELEDILAYASRLMSAFSEDPTAPKGQAVLDSFHSFWQELLSSIDMDGDRRISPEEWQLGFASAYIDDPAGYERAFRPAAEAVLNLADTDNNGTLERDEFARVQTAMRVAGDDVDAAFDHLDADNSNSLSVDELLTAVQEYFTSADPDAPGNWFYGSLTLSA
jgi:Ca2+-binding EF-hand superfamily protein